MRIVTVSPYNIANYGAMLQGWALRRVLEQMGHSVCHLRVPYLWGGLHRGLALLCSHSFASLRNKMLQNKMLRQSFAELGHPPETRCYRSVGQLLAHPPVSDCYIAGSDQIFGSAYFAKEDKARVVLLGFGDAAALRLAYAVSFGSAQWSERELAHARQWNELISRFSAIGAREASGLDILRKWCGLEGAWTADPTLLLERRVYEHEILRDESTSDGNYIFKYLLGFGGSDNRILVENVINAIRNDDPCADSLQIPAVSDSVREWMRAIRNARWVVTNSFHGLCFSLLFHRQFVILGFRGRDSWRNERVLNLLSAIGLESHFVNVADRAAIKFSLRQKVDWRAVDDVLMELRTRGRSFLEASLNAKGGGDA